jgi:PAS domain S-box-containing protein
MLVATLITADADGVGDASGLARLSMGVLLTLFGVAGVATIRRKKQRVSWVAVLLLLATIGLSQLPVRVIGGYSLALYAVPLLLASIMLRPWASLLLSALCCVLILVVGLAVGPFANLPAMAAFFVLILVSWLSTRSLERALENAREAYDQMQESEARYHALFEGVPVGLYRVSPDGRFLDVNQALLEMLGVQKREALLRLNARDLYIQPEDHDRWLQLLERKNIVRRFETEWHGGSGELIEVQSSARAWRHSDGQMAYYEGSVENITRRKKFEQLLLALNRAALAMERTELPEQIFAIVDRELRALGLHCVIMLLNEDKRTFHIQYACYEPYVLDAAQRATDLDLQLDELRVSAVGPLQKVVRDKEPIYVEGTAAVLEQVLPPSVGRFADQLVDLFAAQRAVCAPLIVEDRVIGVLTVHSPDLTETDMAAIVALAHQIAAAWHKVHLLKDLRESLHHLTVTQTQLLQAQKLESIGRLAGGIAHDFSNLLTVMQGHAQLALQRLQSSHPAHDHLSEIETAAKRAAKMTGQLLAFSRREILQKRVQDLNELIAEFSSMLAHSMGEHIDLRLDLSPGLPHTLIDGGALERVLMNLVLNARDAMPDGGTLRIVTKTVDVSDSDRLLPPEATPGPYVELSVTDTGVGMDGDTQTHLFEPFFTTKEPGSGTGLGLAMAYGIVKQHDGWIAVESEPGTGTTVKVYIPVHAGGRVATAGAQDAGALPTGTETVLLAEDEPAVQRFAREVLEGLGYTVLTAGNGEEATQLFSDHFDEVDLLVLDAVMPKVSGSTAYAAMSGLRADVPVLFLTGYSAEIARLTSALGTAVNILRKPFGPPELARRVRDALDEQQPPATG